MADLIRASGGGAMAGDAVAFEASLLDIVDRREHWRAAGLRARAFVADQYGSRAQFTERLLDAIFSLSIPCAEMMKQRGKVRAAAHALPVWRDAFGRAIEEALDASSVPYREAWEVVPHRSRAAAHVGQETAFIPIRLRNVGSHAVLPDGPGARVLVAHTADLASPECEPERLQTNLPALLVPGEEVAAVVRAHVPDLPGLYRIEIRCLETARPDSNGPPDAVVELVVAARDAPVSGSCGPLLQAAGAALAQADRRQTLPDDYADVTEGRLAGLKRRIKQKLLGNFKNAYVDVLSRRQTAFNRALLEAVQHALECSELLDHAISNGQPRDRQGWNKDWNLAIDRALAEGRSEEVSELLKDLLHEVVVSRVRQDALEKRLTALEEAARHTESFFGPRSSNE